LANKLKHTAVLLTFVLVALALTLASAQADTGGDGGAPDPTFGTGGITLTPISQFNDVNGDVTAVAAQPDGDVLVGGYLTAFSAPSGNTGFALARYLPDGSLDPSFGTDGVVNTCVAQPTQCGPGWDGDGSLGAILVQPDGKIVAIGSGEHGLTLVRYDSDGSLDSTFGAGGISPDPSSPDWPPPSLNGGEAAFLQPDGKIVVLIDGAMVNGVLLGQGVARFNADGTPDQTFGTDGVVRVPTPPDQCLCFNGFNSLAPGPNGTIVIGGTQVYRPDPDTQIGSWLVARFNSDGTPDAGFGSDGVAIVPNGGASSTAVQPDGKVVLVDEYDDPTTNERSARLVRLNQDGALDTTFGIDGVVITWQYDPHVSTPGPYVPTLLNGRFVFVQPDGKILVVGDWALRTVGAGLSLAIARFLPDGSIDQSFGTGGTAGVSFGPHYNVAARAAMLQLDGKILVAGSGWPNKPTDAPEISWFAVRYLPDGSTPLAVSTGGNGAGTVDSVPLGIRCGESTCSSQFANQSVVTLTAHPSGVAQVSWGSACGGHELVCQVTVGQATSDVDVTFSVCEVPRLHGKPLSKAKQSLRRAQCSVGRVTHRSSRTVARGRVISEKPGGGTQEAVGAKVALVVSKGRRH